MNEETIDKMVKGVAVDSAILGNILDRTRQEDVVFLILSNPGLSKKLQIKTFKETKDDYARSGLARSANIDAEIFDMVFKDESHTVYSKLGWNDTLSVTQLRKLRAEKDMDLVWFAYNINCPPEIEREILNSTNKSAHYWLQNRKRFKGK